MIFYVICYWSLHFNYDKLYSIFQEKIFKGYFLLHSWSTGKTAFQIIYLELLQRIQTCKPPREIPASVLVTMYVLKLQLLCKAQMYWFHVLGSDKNNKTCLVCHLPQMEPLSYRPWVMFSCLQVPCKGGLLICWVQFGRVTLIEVYWLIANQNIFLFVTTFPMKKLCGSAV